MKKLGDSWNINYAQTKQKIAEKNRTKFSGIALRTFVAFCRCLRQAVQSEREASNSSCQSKYALDEAGSNVVWGDDVWVRGPSPMTPASPRFHDAPFMHS